MENKKLIPMEYNRQVVLATSQLASEYGTDENNIHKNYQNNKDYYIEGEDFYRLEGEDLRQFLGLYLKNLQMQNPEKVRSLYLWTESGALMHVKSLDTEEAWAAHRKLVRDHFWFLAGQYQTLGMVKPQPIPERQYGDDLIRYRIGWRDYILANLFANGQVNLPEWVLQQHGRGYIDVSGYSVSKNKYTVSLIAKKQVLAELVAEGIIEGNSSPNRYRLVASTATEQEADVKRGLLLNYHEEKKISGYLQIEGPEQEEEKEE